MHKEGELTSLRRMEMAISGEIPDVVPVFPRDLTLGLDVSGYTTPEVCGGGYHAEKSARSIIATQERMGHDAVVGAIHHVGMEVPALGGRLDLPEWGIPSIIEHPFSDPGRIENAELPDLDRDDPFPGVMRSYELVADAIGESVAVIANVEGPLTKAGILRGLDTLSLDPIRNPDLAGKLIRFSRELAIDFASVASERGSILCAFMAAASDNPSIFGPSIYREHSLRHLREIVRRLDAKGIPTIFHPHGVFTGDESPLVDETLQTGIRGFQFAEGNDFGLAKRKWGRRTCIMGGIDAFTTLLLGPRGRIDREVKDFMDTCSPGGGYVFMCSCSLHRGIPLDNLKAMMWACRRYGVYPALETRKIDHRPGTGPDHGRRDVGPGTGHARDDGGDISKYWHRCGECGHRFRVLVSRGKACIGCREAERCCPLMRCPECDSSSRLEGGSVRRLSSLIRSYNAMMGDPASR